MNIQNIVELIFTEFYIYYFLYKYLGHKMNKRFILCPIAVVLTIVFSEIILSVVSHDLAYPMRIILTLILHFLLPSIIIKSCKPLPVTIGIVGITTLINAIAFMLIPLSTSSEIFYSVCNIIINLFTLLLIILLSINESITYKFKSLYTNSNRIFIIIDIYIWELVFVVTSLSVLFLQYPHAQIANFVTILIVLSIVISFVSFFLLISKNMKSIHYQSINKLYEKNIEEQVNYYNRLSQYNDDLRKFKHDYENLQIGLLTELKKGNIEEAVKYLNDCNNMINNPDSLYNTGNSIIDSMLYDKSSHVKDKNITINFNGVFPQNPMNTADLCAVFGNLIDNAVEACLKLPESVNKNIEIFLQQRQDYIFITFINPVMETVEIKNNTLTTTKDNKKEHGIGLYSVKKILKKYDGHLDLSCMDNLFTTKFDFQIKAN